MFDYIKMEEKSIFLQVFGDSPKLRIVDFLVVHSEFDYAMKEIALKSGVGYSTLRLLWDDFIKNNIVEFTRTLGKAKLYRLNRNSRVIRSFEKMYWEITDKIIEQRHAKKKILA